MLATLYVYIASRLTPHHISKISLLAIVKMYRLQFTVISFLLLTAVEAQQSNEARIDPVIIQEEAGSCPSTDLLESARSNVSQDIQQALMMLEPPTVLSPCGGIGWRQVADLNMTRSSEQCPPPWIEASHMPRACRSSIDNGGCEGVFFQNEESYSYICGLAVGYAIHTTDAFYAGTRGYDNIDSPYLDGVSITHGSPRQHIWSLAADYGTGFRCPCDNQISPLPRPFVGDNYFCDTNYNGALWDAMDCQSACCTFNSPPFFNVSLPTPTSDAIEVRICTDQHRGDESVYIGVLQLFVQ